MLPLLRLHKSGSMSRQRRVKGERAAGSSAQLAPRKVARADFVMPEIIRTDINLRFGSLERSGSRLRELRHAYMFFQTITDAPGSVKTTRRNA